MSTEHRSKFPDFVPPTKVNYLAAPTLHLRRCTSRRWTVAREHSFDKEEIRIGSMDDNDLVLARRHGVALPLQDRPGGHRLRARRPSARPTARSSTRSASARRSSSRAAPSRVGQSRAEVQRRAKRRSRSSRRAATAAASLIGGNAKMREIYSIIEKIAPTATTVVIEGETGTGKEVVAQAIHELSPRVAGPTRGVRLRRGARRT